MKLQAGILMINPYVFIVGCARSGTTLLERMVDAHPEIAITHQWHTIPRVFEKRKGLTAEGLVTPELISHLLELPWFTRMGISREGLLKLMGNGQSVHYSDFVTGIFELYGKAQGKALVGDKTPNYVRKMRMLHALWPRARFVHLIRDGRDVCLSVANWPGAGPGGGKLAGAGVVLRDPLRTPGQPPRRAVRRAVPLFGPALR